MHVIVLDAYAECSADDFAIAQPFAIERA